MSQQTMQNLRSSQLDTDTKWAAILEEYREKIELLRIEDSKIKDSYKELKQQQDEMALNHGGANVDSSDLLDICAGGKIITVTRGTLTQLQGTLLAALFSGRWENQLQKDGKGHIFLDVNPSCFKSIVDYLNERNISPPDAPLDPPFVEKDDEVFLDRLLKMFGMCGMDKVYCPALDTTTLTESSHAEALRNFLLEDEVHGELELLYRGSRDGFNASDFHTKCDNKGATITVIKDVGGYLFGGFTDESWASKGEWKASNKAFLFSLHCHSGLVPTKLKLRVGQEGHSMFNDSEYGPVFGQVDMYVVNQSNTKTTSRVKVGYAYECPPGQNGQTFLTGNSLFQVAEIEVFCLSQSGTHNGLRKRKRDTITTQSQQHTKPWENLTFDEGLPESMKAALETEQKMLTEANEGLQELKHAFQQEKRFIELFVLGEAVDIITLNVSGEMMSIKRNTLSIYKESVLAKRFNDPLWAMEADDATKLVRTWNHNKVATWISNIDGLSNDTVETLNENNISGTELLALDYETLKFFGITRPAALALLTKNITELQKGDCRRGVLIEQDAYCFGKILDQLRLRAMCDALQDMTPLPPPTIRKSYQKRFKRIVKYYFPGDYASFE